MASTTVTHVCLATIQVAPGSEAQAERRGRGKNTCRCVRPPVGRHCLTDAGHAAMHLGQAGVLAVCREQPSRPCMCLQIQSALPTAGRKEARPCPVCRVAVAVAPPATLTSLPVQTTCAPLCSFCFPSHGVRAGRRPKPLPAGPASPSQRTIHIFGNGSEKLSIRFTILNFTL
jgi:hypothetical protein